jgi:prepilin-type N-terminal cleavage/methylation domain-containing protein
MSKIGSHRSYQAGFTFHELLVAMSLTAVAVLGYSLNTIGALRGTTVSANFTIAVNLAHDKMEQLKASPSVANMDRCPATGDLGINPMGAPGGIFDRCWRVSDSLLGSHLKELEVRVVWQDFESREVVLATLVYVD